MLSKFNRCFATPGSCIFIQCGEDWILSLHLPSCILHHCCCCWDIMVAGGWRGKRQGSTLNIGRRSLFGWRRGGKLQFRWQCGEIQDNYEVQISDCTALAITLVNIQCLPSKLELASYLLPDIDTIIDEPNVMIDLTRHSRWQLIKLWKRLC